MANPYLVAALYASKPSVPAIQEDVKPPPCIMIPVTAPPGTVETHPPISTASNTTSDVCNALGVPAEVKVSPLADYQHIKEESERDEKSTSDSILSTVPGITQYSTPPQPSQPSNNVPSCTSNAPIATLNVLTLPLASYLPPPGMYFDQYTMESLLDGPDLLNKCYTCWNDCGRRGKCGKKCGLCGMQTHSGKACDQLYCTEAWYLALEIPRNSDQVRPAAQDVATLKRLGMITNSNTLGVPILPNLDQHAVRTFYCNRDVPKMSHTRFKKVGRKKPLAMRQLGPTAVESSVRTRAMVLRSFENITSGSRNVVNSMLDPRLQSRTAALIDNNVNGPPAASELIVQSTALGSRNGGILPPEESKLQELEDEVLGLKRETIEKDRVIRKLAAEIEELRGGKYATGSKRPCV